MSFLADTAAQTCIIPTIHRNLLSHIKEIPGSICGVGGIKTQSVGRGELTIIVEPQLNYPDYPYFKRFFASVQGGRVASAAQADDDDEPPGLVVDDSSSDESESVPNRVLEAQAGQYLRSGGFGKAANQVDINSAYLHGSATKSKPRGGRRGSGAIKNS